MSFLSDDNYVNSAINKLSSTEINKRKYMFIEALIRFLELYGNNEIGNNVELDFEKISLYINSPTFENSDLTEFKTIDDIYSYLEKGILEYNIPLFRFFKLSEYQSKIFEQDHYDRLIQSYKEDCKKYPCLGCIFYNNGVTSIGVYSTCKCPKEITKSYLTRRGYLDISKKTKCKYVVSLDNVEKFKNKIDNKNYSNHEKRSIMLEIDSGEKRLKEKIKTMDNSIIPPFIPEDDKFKTDYNFTEDLGRVFNGKLSYEDMKKNYIKAIFLEGMIKFIELYAQIEYGSNFIADIAKIVEYTNNIEVKFNCINDVYTYLEGLIFEGKDITQFITYNMEG